MDFLEYCVDCRYYSTKVKGHNTGYDGSCTLLKKNVYETDRGCQDFQEEV